MDGVRCAVAGYACSPDELDPDHRSFWAIGEDSRRRRRHPLLLRWKKPMKLAGKSAVVTGGSQGLGLEISRRFLREGARVFICARTGSQLREASERLETEAPGRVSAEPA